MKTYAHDARRAFVQELSEPLSFVSNLTSFFCIAKIELLIGKVD